MPALQPGSVDENYWVWLTLYMGTCRQWQACQWLHRYHKRGGIDEHAIIEAAGRVTADLWIHAILDIQLYRLQPMAPTPLLVGTLALICIWRQLRRTYQASACQV